MDGSPNKGSQLRLERTISELNSIKSELILERQALAESNTRLLEMAMTDSLTGLSNRRHFFDHLEQELYRRHLYNEALSLIILDIDFFKRINDQYGHQCGDEILIHFAKVLRHNISKADLAARIGGEEFAVLMSDTDHTRAHQAAAAIQQSLKCYPFVTLGGEPVTVTCSIGLCSLDNCHPADSNILYKLTDEALYLAKSSGRNCVKSVDYQSAIKKLHLQ